MTRRPPRSPYITFRGSGRGRSWHRGIADNSCYGSISCDRCPPWPSPDGELMGSLIPNMDPNFRMVPTALYSIGVPEGRGSIEVPNCLLRFGGTEAQRGELKRIGTPGCEWLAAARRWHGCTPNGPFLAAQGARPGRSRSCYVVLLQLWGSPRSVKTVSRPCTGRVYSATQLKLILMPAASEAAFCVPVARVQHAMSPILG